MTTTYKLTKDPITGNPDTVVKKIVDGAVNFIPCDSANTDYQEYLAWVAEGNTAETES